MQIDIERVEKYIDEIAAETIDLEIVLTHPDEVILQDPHLLMIHTDESTIITNLTSLI